MIVFTLVFKWQSLFRRPLHLLAALALDSPSP
jgi:hypothetical protein